MLRMMAAPQGPHIEGTIAYHDALEGAMGKVPKLPAGERHHALGNLELDPR